VVVNVMRGGPGLGNIAPSQGDYFQATRSLGHGDSHGMVLAPSTVQEAMDLVGLAFELAERYRLPAVIAADGIVGQMMEPVGARAIGAARSGPHGDLPGDSARGA
jgi:2-oxoglutarate ferredoxin oxidoreductase subunit alpha